MRVRFDFGGQQIPVASICTNRRSGDLVPYFYMKSECQRTAGCHLSADTDLLRNTGPSAAVWICQWFIGEFELSPTL